jgi:DNA-directed RNA polymerase specialized sigma24 family protein
MTNPEQNDALPARRNQVFATTHWSVVVQAGAGHSTEGAAALEKLCRTYWFPLFAFVRRLGHEEADAKDLTQEFFARLLERQDFQNVNARKGKFRTFLLVSLQNFLSNQRDHARAAKRGGGKIIISLDALPLKQVHAWEPSTTQSPAQLFDQRWAMSLLAETVRQLEEEMTEAGRSEQFAALKTFLTNEPGEGEYLAVAHQLGTSSQSIAVAVHRMRQRYRELVRTEVAHTVSSPLEVEEEMRHLYAALNP